MAELGQSADQGAADLRIVLHEEEMCHVRMIARQPFDPKAKAGS
jgi:hypothetical protein